MMGIIYFLIWYIVGFCSFVMIMKKKYKNRKFRDVYRPGFVIALLGPLVMLLFYLSEREN